MDPRKKVVLFLSHPPQQARDSIFAYTFRPEAGKEYQRRRVWIFNRGFYHLAYQK